MILKYVTVLLKTSDDLAATKRPSGLHVHISIVSSVDIRIARV